MTQEGFLTNEEVSDALGRGAGMFHIPDIASEEGTGFHRKGFYVEPDDGEAGVVVVLADQSAILVHPEDFTVDHGWAIWIGEGSRRHYLRVIGRARNVGLLT